MTKSAVWVPKHSRQVFSSIVLNFFCVRIVSGRQNRKRMDNSTMDAEITKEEPPVVLDWEVSRSLTSEEIEEVTAEIRF